MRGAKWKREMIEGALEKVSAEIAANTDNTSLYSRGLSSEGYDGGYRDALNDVLLVLNGVKPSRRIWWTP